MKIIAVCGNGLGTSLVIKMTLMSVLKEEGIEADIEVADLGTAFSYNPDLFVCTPEMEDKCKAKGTLYGLVKNVADKGEFRQKVLPLVQQLLKSNKK